MQKRTIIIFLFLLKIKLACVKLKSKPMLRKLINILISILLVVPLLVGMPSSFGLPNDSDSQVRFQKPCEMDPCDMDHCSPRMPKCPLCPTSGSFAPYLHDVNGTLLPIPTSSFIFVNIDTLSDQGVVKAIFHPPTSVL